MMGEFDISWQCSCLFDFATRGKDIETGKTKRGMTGKGEKGNARTRVRVRKSEMR